MTRAVQTAAPAKPRNIKELFLYRLNVLANISGRMAAMQNARSFGVSMLDWRMLALLSIDAPMSLNRLALETNLDKSQASRSIAKLISLGFVKRDTDEDDGRGVQLKLTAKGTTLYRGMLPIAVQRNRKLLQVLDNNERAMLEAMLAKLAKRAAAMLAEERALAVSDAASRTRSTVKTKSTSRKKR